MRKGCGTLLIRAYKKAQLYGAGVVLLICSPSGEQERCSRYPRGSVRFLGKMRQKEKVYDIFKILYSLEELQKLATVMQAVNLVIMYLLFYSTYL